LARYLRDATTRIGADPKAILEADESAFIDGVLAGAQPTGASRTRGQGRPNAASGTAKLGWFDSLDGFGSLDLGHDLETPGITCLDGQTIHCQSAQSYTQWVPLHDVDAAQTICPVGHSERLDSRFRTSTLALWGAAALHAAPLSREAVEKIAVERRRF
jgi:hypothetical protein